MAGPSRVVAPSAADASKSEPGVRLTARLDVEALTRAVRRRRRALCRLHAQWVPLRRRAPHPARSSARFREGLAPAVHVAVLSDAGVLPSADRGELPRPAGDPRIPPRRVPRV